MIRTPRRLPRALRIEFRMSSKPIDRPGVPGADRRDDDGRRWPCGCCGGSGRAGSLRRELGETCGLVGTGNADGRARRQRRASLQDAHIHPIEGGSTSSRATTSTEAWPMRPRTSKRFRHTPTVHPDRAWITGSGWFAAGIPSRRAACARCSTRYVFRPPALLERRRRHVAWANFEGPHHRRDSLARRPIPARSADRPPRPGRRPETGTLHDYADRPRHGRGRRRRTTTAGGLRAAQRG